MKYLVYIDDKEASLSAFYRVLNLVKENDWVIIVAKVKFYKGVGHRSTDVMKHFTRLLDKKHIKNLTFIESGSIKNIIKNKVKLLKIDMILIASHNSKTKRLCNYCSENISCNLMVVREFHPKEDYLIPPTGSIDYSTPLNMNPLSTRRPLMQSESMSSIETIRYKEKEELPIPTPAKQPTTTKSELSRSSGSISLNKQSSSSIRAGKDSIYTNPINELLSSDESDEEIIQRNELDDTSEYRLVSTPTSSSTPSKHDHDSELSKSIFSTHPQKSREVI